MTRGRHHPADVAARVAMAVGGGYALTLLAARLLARTLPLDGGEASIAASIAVWPLYLATVVWVFAARRPIAALLPPALAVAALYAATR